MDAVVNYHVMRVIGDDLVAEDVLCIPHAYASLPPEANGDITQLNGGDYIECDTTWCSRCYACEEKPKELP